MEADSSTGADVPNRTESMTRKKHDREQNKPHSVRLTPAAFPIIR